MGKLIEEAIDVILKNDRGGFTIPTNRLYPYQWNWDSGFTALGISLFDKERAWKELNMLIDSQWEDGMIPHIIFHQNDPDYFPGPKEWTSDGLSRTSCHSQPPILASVIWTMVQRGTEFDKLEASKLFKPLMNYHRWFFSARDPENEGYISIVHPWESGRDNCPDWDLGLDNMKIPENMEQYSRRDTSHVDESERPTKDQYDKYMSIVHFGRNCHWDKIKMHFEGPFSAVDPGVNFILLRASKDLLSLARYLGHDETFDEINNWIQSLNKGCQKMWNNDVLAFTAWDKKSEKFSDAITSASMLCLYAGAGTSKQQKHMIEHCERILKDCNFGFPSLDPSHPGFEGKRYWRGPVWSIMNYLIAIGLGDVGEDKLAKKIKTDTIKLTEQQGMAEYFDPHTGIGLGGKDFSWTAAIYLELLREDIDINIINTYKDKKNGLNKT